MKKGWLTAALVLIGKSAKFAKVFKVLKVLKFTKPLVTFFTMAASAFVYAFWLGPWFSIGFVIMLFIHEIGHIMAMRMKGMSTPGPVFIPMLGAVIFAPAFKSKRDEAFIGFAGPLVGGAAAAMLFGIWLLLPEKSEIILMVSYTAAFINVFNLLPIRPLDGGRTTQIIGEWFKYVGLVGLLLLTLYIRQPAFLLIWILVIIDTNLEPWFKFGVGATCQLAMMLLMFAGFSEQMWWADAIDIFLATFFNLMLFASAKKFVEDQNTQENTLPNEIVSMKLRIIWFLCYLALVVALVILMNFQAPYLPKTVKG